MLALSVVWAVIGYVLSERSLRSKGRTPWGLPSLLWAFFWFLSLILGLVLYFIASATDARRAQRIAMQSHQGAPAARHWSAGSAFPAYPRPANSPGYQTPGRPVPGRQIPGQQPPIQQTAAPEAPIHPDAPIQQPATGQVSPPAWHPDPSGRFHYRWWDGNHWTAQVSFNGQHLVDTNPDQRIGPY